MARSHYRANAAKECPSHPQQAQTWTQVQSCGAARAHSQPDVRHPHHVEQSAVCRNRKVQEGGEAQCSR